MHLYSEAMKSSGSFLQATFQNISPGIVVPLVLELVSSCQKINACAPLLSSRESLIIAGCNRFILMFRRLQSRGNLIFLPPDIIVLLCSC